MRALSTLGINLNAITDKLQVDGVASFASAYDRVLNAIGRKVQETRVSQYVDSIARADNTPTRLKGNLRDGRRQCARLSGPDLRAGVKFDGLAESEPLLGHFDGEPVILVRQGDQLFATGAVCTHYGGPLAEGLVVDETIRCPWHHARFDLRTGEAEGAPALNPLSCFNVQRQEDMVMVGGKKAADFRVACPLNPSSVVIVGAGAAGAACADMLRTKGYAGPVTLAGDEEPGPVDRPNLSKDFLAGTAAEDWISLRTREYYESIKVDLITDDPAVRISPADTRSPCAAAGHSATARCCWRPGQSLARFPSKARTCRMFTG